MLAFNETYVTPSGADGLADVGHGADWLQEHIQYAYEVAWSNPVVNGAGLNENRKRASYIPDWYDHPLEQDAAI